MAGVWGGQPCPQGFTLRKWEEPEAPLPFSDGKALGTRLYGGRESCEYKGTPENKKGIPFFLPRTLRAAIGHRVLSHIHYFFPFPPPPTDYVRIRLKSGAIIGVGDRKCRVHAVSLKKPNELFLEQGPITIRTNCTTRRHKLTRELASLRGSRVEF